MFCLIILIIEFSSDWLEDETDPNYSSSYEAEDAFILARPI